GVVGQGGQIAFAHRQLPPPAFASAGSEGSCFTWNIVHGPCPDAGRHQGRSPLPRTGADGGGEKLERSGTGRGRAESGPQSEETPVRGPIVPARSLPGGNRAEPAGKIQDRRAHPRRPGQGKDRVQLLRAERSGKTIADAAGDGVTGPSDAGAGACGGGERRWTDPSSIWTTRPPRGPSRRACLKR